MALRAKAAPKGLTVRKKKTAKLPVARRNGKKIGPSFDGWESWSPSDYMKNQQKARDFYYENYQPADLEPDVWEWMRTQEYTTNDIKYAKAYGISMSVGITCKLLRDGMPDYNAAYAAYWESLPGTSGIVKPHSEFIKLHIAHSIERGNSMVIKESSTEKKKKNIYIPSIQERMREVAHEMSEFIEEAIDSYIIDPETFDPASYKIAATLRGKQTKAGHARLIKSLYIKDLEEYTQLVSPDCPKDLMEGYTVYGKKNIKKFHDFLTQITNACDQIAGEAKITRLPRKIKVKSPEDQTKNIKFKATDDRYGIASVPPSQIIGASTVVVLNTKTRKIGVYYADKGAQVLAVKGSTIIGFDERTSIQKTLRKPEIQIKELKAIGTQKRTQTWFDGIKTIGTTMNGRINSEVMILKAYK